MKKLSTWLLLSCIVTWVFTSCEGETLESCPDMAFEIEKINTTNSKTTQIDSSTRLKFTADFPEIANTPYQWFVNDSVVDSEIVLDDRDNVYVDFFEPGTYEVCIKAETSDCPNGASFCETITVEEPHRACPNVNFTMDIEPGTSIGYGFLASFDGIEDVTSFKWFINDEQIEHPDDPQIGSNYIHSVLEPGVEYTICLKVLTPNCLDGASFCKKFVAGEDVECPTTIFGVQPQEHKGNYKFIAEIQREDALYYWYINDTLAGDAGSGVFQYDFLQDNTGQVPGGPGEYEICLVMETPNCSRELSEKTCVKIIVEDPINVCPELSFIEEPINRNTKQFYPNVVGIEGEISIAWYIDEQFIENQPSSEYVQFSWDLPGSYQVCAKIETQGCEEVITFCKVIEIEGSCPDISFNEEQNGDSFTYFFYPNAFEGIDDTQIDWFVAGDFVGSSSGNAHNEPFSYQFGKAGIYYICMKIETPFCPNGVEYCKTITVGEVCPSLPVFDYYLTPNSTNLYQFSIRELEWELVTGYRWYINGELLVTPNGSPFTDNLIGYALAPGEYNICAVALSENCAEGSEFCRTIQIE